MEKYNKLLRNITKLIEKGLFTSKDFKKEVEDALKFKIEILANKLKLVPREEFEDDGSGLWPNRPVSESRWIRSGFSDLGNRGH